MIVGRFFDILASIVIVAGVVGSLAQPSVVGVINAFFNGFVGSLKSAARD